jgi:hypothetical protein
MLPYVLSQNVTHLRTYKENILAMHESNWETALTPRGQWLNCKNTFEDFKQPLGKDNLLLHIPNSKVTVEHNCEKCLCFQPAYLLDIPSILNEAGRQSLKLI